MAISSEALDQASLLGSSKERSTANPDGCRRNQLRNGINLKFKYEIYYI